MEELIERYEKRMKSLNEIISETQTIEGNELIHTRLVSKSSVYRTVITELKQLVKDHEV